MTGPLNFLVFFDGHFFMPGYLFVYSTKDSDAMMQPVTDTAVEVLDYFARTKVRRAFFSERVTSDWNSLPDTVVGAATVDRIQGGPRRTLAELGLYVRPQLPTLAHTHI